MTFGIGVHRCIGAPIASAEMRIALQAILERIPDYRIDTDAITPAETVGIVFGHFSIPMTFTAGPRAGP
jgi:cytochrome P450